MLVLSVGGGLIVIIGIVIAILNTYNDVFEDALKPKPQKKPNKALDVANPKEVNDNTPAKKFTDEVMGAYPNLLQVSAQITLGSSCTAQIFINVSTYNQFKANKDWTKKFPAIFVNGLLNIVLAPPVREMYSTKKSIQSIPKDGPNSGEVYQTLNFVILLDCCLM